MSSAPQRRPVTIEDLLRLKRAERPPAEFWTEWDRQLRTKQLAAILDKRPWWRDALPRLGLALGRYHLPLGATAILALTILTVREYRSVNTELPVPAATPVARIGAPSTKIEGADTGSLAELRQPANVARDEVAEDSAQPQKVAHTVSLLPTTRDSVMDAMSRPAAREIAANLAVARATDPGLARILKSAVAYELVHPPGAGRGAARSRGGVARHPPGAFAGLCDQRHLRSGRHGQRTPRFHVFTTARSAA
jgi:hypothetical protein